MESQERAARAPLAWKRLGLLLIAGSLLLLSITGGWLPGVGQVVRWALHAALALGAVGAVFCLVRTFDHTPNATAAIDATFSGNLECLLQLLENAGRQAIETEEPFEFAERLAMPYLSRKRVVEDFRLESGHITRTARVEYCIKTPTDKSPFVYMPLLRPQRGHLIDNFQVESTSGELLTTLSRQQTLELIAVSLRALFAQSAAGRQSTEQSVLTEMRILAAPVLGDPNGVAAVPPDAPLLRQFVQALVGSYAVVAVIPRGYLKPVNVDRSGFTVFYSYTMPLAHITPADGGRLDRIRGWLRDIAFLPPYEVEIDAGKVLRCESYHLTVRSPEGYVVRATDFNDANGRIARKQGSAITGPHYRIVPAATQPFVHLYTRNFAESDTRRPVFRVRFQEILPGSLGRAALTAILTVFVVWLGGAFAGTRGDGRAEVFALALAFPALVATWLSSEQRKSGGESLTARVSTAASIMLCVLGIAFVAAEEAGRLGQSTITRGSVLFVSNRLWAIALAVSVANAFSISVVLYSGYRRNRNAIRRDGAHPWKHP